MTIYTRPDELVFAEQANPGEVVDFPNILRGWGLAFEQTEGKPPMEWFNAILKRQDEAIRYLLQRGVAQWSTTEDYPIEARVQHGGTTYRSLVANSGIEPGTSAITWAPWGLEVASTDEAQALTNDARALTPKKLGDVLGSGLLSQNGYAEVTLAIAGVPKKLIVQWGFIAAGLASGTSRVITFPIAFPEKILSSSCTAQANAIQSANGSWWTESYMGGKTSMTVYYFGGPDTTAQWIAIGH